MKEIEEIRKKIIEEREKEKNEYLMRRKKTVFQMIMKKYFQKIKNQKQMLYQRMKKMKK